MISCQDITRFLVVVPLVLFYTGLFAEDSSLPNSHSDEPLIVWRDIAPSLVGLREANPEMFNTIANGTLDSFTADEHLSFLDDLILTYFNSSGSCVFGFEALIERRRDNRQTRRENMRHLPPWFQDSFAKTIAKQTLFLVQMYDRDLQLEQCYREGNPNCLKLYSGGSARAMDALSL